jgi:hypothetical protein
VIKKRWFQILLPLLVTGGIFLIFFRRTGWRDVGLYMVISLLGIVVRSARYRILLSGRIRRVELFLITLVQNFSADLLPARSASLLFYTYLTRRQGVILEEGASSFVIAVFYDALALGLMLGAAALVFLQSWGTDVPAAALAVGLIVIIAFSLLVIFLAKRLSNLGARIFRWLKLDKIAAAFAAVEDYFSRHVAASERLRLLGLSALIKLIKYVSVYVLFIGMSGAVVSGRSLSLFSFGIAGAELSSLLPIQGLAGLGTWEAAFALVAGKIGLALKSPFLTALVIHLITQIWEYSLGLGALWILSVRARGKD